MNILVQCVIDHVRILPIYDVCILTNNDWLCVSVAYWWRIIDSLQDVSKRMSLPMDIRLPPEFLKKLQMEREMESENNSPPCKPLSRMSRRASLVSTPYLVPLLYASYPYTLIHPYPKSNPSNACPYGLHCSVSHTCTTIYHNTPIPQYTKSNHSDACPVPPYTPIA